MKKHAIIQIGLLVAVSLIGGMDNFIQKSFFEESIPNTVSQRELRQVGKLLPLFKESENIWPGFKLDETPLLLTFGTGRLYAIGWQPKGESWKKNSLNEREIFISESDAWGLTGIKMHPSFEIEGQKAFVFQMSKGSHSRHVFAHERFHLFQFKNFEMTLNSEEGYTDHLSPSNLTLAKLEDLLLRAFLESSEHGERQDYLRDFLVVHKERESLISPSSLKWENHQQKIEGLADYVACKLVEGESGLLNLQEEGTLSDYIIKWRHYFVGATLGFALDFLEVPNWKTDVQSGKPLIQCLEENLFASQELLEGIKQRFNFTSIEKQVEQKVLEYASELQALKENYENLDGFPVRLGTPRGVGITGGGSTDRLFSLEDGTTISLQDRSLSTTSDSKWTFSTKSIPYLIKNGRGFREFKADEEIQVYVNKRALPLQHLLEQPGEYPFLSLHFEGKHFDFSSEKHFGVIVSDGSSLSIVYL